MDMKSLLLNLFLPERVFLRHFTKENLRAIESKISECEKNNSAQIVFAYQTYFKLIDFLKGRTPRDVARRQFRKIGVWNTASRSGILFYLILADKQLEIVADIEISKVIPQEKWDDLSAQISEFLKSQPINEAVMKGIELIAELVGAALPVNGEVKNELDDGPIKIK